MTSRAGHDRRSWRCRSSKPIAPRMRSRSDLQELRAGDRAAGARRAGGRLALSRRAVWLGRLDRLLRAYEHRPLAPLRRLALARAERWIVRRQEADGSWGGIQPPWVYSLMALRLCGYPLEHPVIMRGLEGLERFMVEDRDDSRGVGAPAGPSRRLEACQSPVWDTALAMIALADAGLEVDHPAMLAAARWLLGEEVAERGDWSVSAARAARRRLGIRVRQRQLPRRRRHGRGGARARAPRRRRAVASADRRRDRPRVALGGGDAERGRRLGRVRCRQHALART